MLGRLRCEAKALAPHLLILTYAWALHQVSRLIRTFLCFVVLGVYINRKRVCFSTSKGLVNQDYDLLVGADGIGSTVRAALQQHSSDMSVVISDSGREYKTYSAVRGDIEPAEFKINPGATLHLYTSDDSWTTFTAHSNPDGTYSGTFSLKTGGRLGQLSDGKCAVTGYV